MLTLLDALVSSVLMNSKVIIFSALPDLCGMRNVMDSRGPLLWSASDELPIEVNLPRKLRFHSIFSCPIFRKQTTMKNPPQRLKCGHAISKDALGLRFQWKHSIFFY